MTALSNIAFHSPTRLRPADLIPAGANRLQLSLANGQSRELSHAKVGRFFIFGLMEDKLSWSLIRLSQISAIDFQTEHADLSPAVSWTRKAAGELLATLPLPANASICFQVAPTRKLGLVVLGTAKGLIATESYSHPFIPLQAVSYLEISPTQDNGKEFLL